MNNDDPIIEAIARGLALDRIEFNMRYEKDRRPDEFIAGCVDRSWPHFVGSAPFVLRALRNAGYEISNACDTTNTGGEDA